MRLGIFGNDQFGYNDSTERMAREFRVTNGLLWSRVDWSERFLDSGEDVVRKAFFYRPVRVNHYTMGATEFGILKENGKLPWEFNPNTCRHYD